jgi:hypothetical protein
MRCALTIVLSTWFAAGLAIGASSQLQHGSLVIAMPVASGWVVCGDKRKMSNLVDPTEDEVKVFELGPGVVAAATGLRRVIEEKTLFDVVEQVRAFARTRPFDGRDDYAESLAKALGADFSRMVPERIWAQVERQERAARSAFTVALFWKTAAGLPRWADVNFHLVANLTVVDELQHGSQPAFGDARRDPEMRRFLMPPYAWRERTAGEAERFGRRLIEFTSARLGELQRTPPDIGPSADCLRVM